jgi:hypothetical protein
MSLSVVGEGVSLMSSSSICSASLDFCSMSAGLCDTAFTDVVSSECHESYLLD